MRYVLLLDVDPSEGWHDDENIEDDVADHLGSVDMQEVIAKEVAQREMLLDDGVGVAILDVQQVNKNVRHLGRYR